MAGRLTIVASLLAGIALLAGCDRSEPAPGEPAGLALPHGDDLGNRQLADVRSIRGRGGAAGGGALRLARDEQWVKLPAQGWRLGRLAVREHEMVFAWLSDGRPLAAEPPSFQWDAVDSGAVGGPHDHLVVMPLAQRRRPQGYVVDGEQVPARPQRARAVLADIVGRELTDHQARQALELARRVERVDETVLDWLEALADGRIDLATVRRGDAGIEGGGVLGRRQIELHVGRLDDPRTLGMLRGEAALTLLAVSGQQRRDALARVLADDDAAIYALRSLEGHLPLTRPMAEALVELMRQRLREAREDEIDALRVQITAVLDVIGGHVWELLTPEARAGAERREARRGGERNHLDLAVDLGIATMEHPSWDVQQVGFRMVQRWTDWGWQIPQRRRLEEAVPGLGSEQVRERLTALLEEADH